MSIALQEMVSYFSKNLTSYNVECDFQNNELTLRTDLSHLWKLLSFLKNDSSYQFLQLMDICGIDRPAEISRFEIVYTLLSLHQNLRVQVSVQVDSETLVPSLGDLYKSAWWFEREIWDMFGIKFSKHPDLRRLLTEPEFEGHPLRKDFPLSGFRKASYEREKEGSIKEGI